jgi:hypothetical protein
VVPVIPPYLLICGAIDPSTPEGVVTSHYPSGDSSCTRSWVARSLTMRIGKLDLAETAKRAFALASTGTEWRHPWATDVDLLFRDASDVSRGECRVIHMCHEKPPRPNVARTIAGALSSAVLWEASEYGWDGAHPARWPGSFQGGSGAASQTSMEACVDALHATADRAAVSSV